MGFLPLAYVSSRLFGRYLVSLPYLNYGGPVASNASITRTLVERAVSLADELEVRHLELRNETAVEHPAINKQSTIKAHMRLDLPSSAAQLWDSLNPKVRNQVRKGQKSDLTVHWGREELLNEFYAVFSRNMRDLGTPVYGRSLFANILRFFPSESELCVVRAGTKPVAAAALAHGWGVTEVPSASSIREFNPSCANMLMYWNLLERAIQHGQQVFDFGRSSEDSNTFRFKRQWGAAPAPSIWQYVVREGDTADVRPENPRYQRLIGWWQKLPVGVSRLLGPPIVRGIP
jgi:FemAB-related protein (PEP-CTERM system-associated)